MPVMVIHRKLLSYGLRLTLFPTSAAEESQVSEGLTLTLKVQKHSCINYKSILKAQR